MTLAATTTVVVLFGGNFENRAICRLLKPGPGDPDEDLEAFELLTSIPEVDAGWDGAIAGPARKLWKETEPGKPLPRRRPARPASGFPRDTITYEAKRERQASDLTYRNRKVEPLSRREKERLQAFGDRVVGAYLHLVDEDVDEAALEAKLEMIDTLLGDERRLKVSRLKTGRTAPFRALGGIRQKPCWRRPWSMMRITCRSRSIVMQSDAPPRPGPIRWNG